MSRSSSRLKKQNELIRSLQRQLEAKEQELAGQKWVFEQFLQSPAWRITYPIRWLARRLRALRAWVSGEIADNAGVKPAPASMPVAAGFMPASSAEDIEPPDDAKDIFTQLQRANLQSFLSSNAMLELPCSPDPEVSILLVLYNRAELTLACLRSIAENYPERLEVVIVDNASSDETGLLLDRVRGARIIRNTENLNFLLGVNQAARESSGKYLLLLNNDAQLLPGTLRSALTAMHSAPDIGAVGGRLILLDGTLQEAGSIIWRDGSCLGYGRGDNPFAPMYMFRRDVDYCSGAFLLTPRATWERLGGFDEIYKPAYYEETDYCTRLWENGLRVVYEPAAAVAHYEFASSGTTEEATDLQREHQYVFSGKHGATLEKHHPADLNRILEARMKGWTPKRVLFIDDRVPHPWLGSGFPRAQAILLTLLNESYFATFYPMSVPDEDWSTVYSDMPREVEFMTGYGPPLLEAFLRNRRGYYDTIIISRPHNMKLVQPILAAYPDWFDQVKIIYDGEAIFAGREIGLRRLTATPLSEEETRQLIKEEVDLASNADYVVSVSEYERAAFVKNGIERVHVVGHTIPVAPTPRPFHERSGFLFVGAIHEEASPNSDAVLWFLEEIFPRIREVLGDGASFTLAGVNNSERIRQLAGGPGPSLRIMGHVRDLTGLYDAARVFVAPTRYAAGIPHKVHEAAARGLPVVGTPLLASQLGWQDGGPFSVGVDAESFAQKCIELHTNPELWLRLRAAGLERIRTECSKEVFEARLKEILTARRGRYADVGMDR